jgi:hypothetical protein
MKNETINFSTFYQAEVKNELITFHSKNGTDIFPAELKKYFPYIPIEEISIMGLRHFPDGEFHEIGFFRIYDCNLRELVKGKAERFFKNFLMLIRDLQLANLFLERKMTSRELFNFFNKFGNLNYNF